MKFSLKHLPSILEHMIDEMQDCCEQLGKNVVYVEGFNLFIDKVFNALYSQVAGLTLVDVKSFVYEQTQFKEDLTPIPDEVPHCIIGYNDCRQRVIDILKNMA